MTRDLLLDALSIDRMRSDLEHIAHDIPSRLAGSENGRRMAEYSAAGLQVAGIKSTVHTLPGLVSFPEATQLTILGQDVSQINAFTLGHSLPTDADGVVADLVDVGPGGFEHYDGKDVVGRIVLQELSYHPGRHEKQRIAALKGAAGCIMMNWGPDSSDALPFGSVKPAWGNPTPDTLRHEMTELPCIGISRAAGVALRARLARGEKIMVRLSAVVENGWRAVHVTTGAMAAGGDDFVVLGGHQDSWPGPQATDNAAGSACLLELARVFSSRRGELRRGLQFGFWTAHETGTMVGSTWFVDRHWDRLRRHAVGYLQIDQPGCVGTTQWATASNAEMRETLDGITAEMLPDHKRSWRPNSKLGDASFFGLGVPMFAGQGTFTAEELKRTANANLGWWHHSLENTIDKVDWNYMSAHLRVYGAWLWELCTAAVLPYTFTPVAEQIAARLEALREPGAAIGLEGAAARAGEFLAAARRLDEATAAWGARYRAGEASASPAGMLNDCLKRLSRILIPVQSTVKGIYGHDSYALTAQTTLLPGLFDTPRFAGMPEAEERWVLETQLVRERNRVADALDDATQLIETTLRHGLA